MKTNSTTRCETLPHCCWLRSALVAILLLCSHCGLHADSVAVVQYRERVLPILEQHCYDCHGNGSEEGGVDFEAISAGADILKRQELWLAVLNNVRSGLMPPPNEVDVEDRPTKEEIRQLEDWIKFQAFEIEPNNVDPGRVILRRLNRVEYQNTIRDLMDYEFRADREFPPDDTGGGFDNNGDVLSLSTLLIEKYLAAAESIVLDAVPQSSTATQPTERSERKKKKSNEHKKQYERFFPDGPAPEQSDARDRYARKILRQFAARAFRRPVTQDEVTPLVDLTRRVYSQSGNSFEQGVGRAMMAVLASPKFLFRIDSALAKVESKIEVESKVAVASKVEVDSESFALVDEHALASRLSYFIWSTMPDRELTKLADAGRLRDELPSQVRRMLKDSKVKSGLVSNFTGQWLQTRDIDSVEINGKAVLGKGKVYGNRKTKYDFDRKIRSAMRQETERYFAHVLGEDRSILEFINSDYTFLNEQLAKQYNIDNVKGDAFRLVKLPQESYRGGVLTQGSVLAVTSNPTRTSPVKRGVFVLENILGTPPPPPPPNVADLELTIAGGKATTSLRDALAMHRENAICSSCHNRMDPIGLAFENFIPMGNWRSEEANKPIDASGQLITGERFQDVRDLKRILANQRRDDFYRCISKKLLAYAIGRAVDFRDTHTTDVMVGRLNEDNGRFSTLIMAVIDSPQFQRQRHTQSVQTSKPSGGEVE